MALALVAGIVGTTVGLVRTEQARNSAEKRLAQIEKGIDLLGSLFADLDPKAEEKEGRPLRAILGDRLDHATADLDGDALGDPLVVARLQDRLGQTYLGLGHAAKAEVLFSKAATTREAHLGEDHPLTLASRHNQALACCGAGKRNEAIQRFEQVLGRPVQSAGSRPPGFPEHPSTNWRPVLNGKPADPSASGARARRASKATRGGPRPDPCRLAEPGSGAYLRPGSGPRPSPRPRWFGTPG